MGKIVGDSAEPAVRFWCDVDHLQLADGVQLASVADGRPALRNQGGRRVALSSGSAWIIEMLRAGCAGRQLFELADDLDLESRERAQTRIAAFLDGLGAASMITARRVGPPTGPWARFVGSDFFPRLPVFGRVEPFFARIGALLRARMPPRRAVLVVGVAGVLAVAVLPLLLFIKPVSFDPVLLWWLPAFMVFQIGLHETMHGIAMGYLGVPVKSAGIGLLLFVFPTAYVDRTGMYEVRSRSARCAVALAGPFSDLLLLAGVVLLRAFGPDEASGLFTLVAIVYAIGLAVNLNPLFLTDGQQALEAVLGAVNVRARSFLYLGAMITRRAVPLPIADASDTERRLYLGYALAAVSYVVLVGAWSIHLILVYGGGQWATLSR